jgi:hypothetical protein
MLNLVVSGGMSDSSTLFYLLADDCRRLILFLLCREDTLTVPDDLKTRGQVCNPGRSRSTGNTPGNGQPDPLEEKLYHVHLPKLVSEDLIRWDRESGTVSKGPAFEEYGPALRAIVDNAERFPIDLI